MSSDNQDDAGGSYQSHHRRRSSIAPGTSPATSLYNRRDSIAAAVAPPAMMPTGDAQRDRRFSVSAALGLATFRRGSTSTTAEESAVDDDSPSTPFTRRMSIQPSRAFGIIPGGSPTTDQPSSYDWSASLRARAQSSVGTVRPVLGTSPPRDTGPQRAQQPVVADMPEPPSQAAMPKPPPRRKPDHYQERILKGDFYMD